MKGKIIVFVGVLIGLLAGVMVLVLMGQRSTAVAADPTPEPPTVVRAAQNIAKGDVITLEGVQLVRLESGEAAPPTMIKDPMKIVGLTAAMDVPQGTIIQQEMVFDPETSAQTGDKPAASLFQPGRVAMAFPIGDLASVGGAVKNGDRVNILASFEMIDVGRESQIRLPLEGGGEQLPRMIVQTILQNVEVLRVGAWPSAVTAAGNKENPPIPITTEMITVLVTPQDSLVLKWLVDKMDEGQARVALVLRSEDESEDTQTESVSLEYLMKRFNVPIPPKLDVTTDEIRVKGSLEVR